MNWCGSVVIGCWLVWWATIVRLMDNVSASCDCSREILECVSRYTPLRLPYWFAKPDQQRVTIDNEKFVIRLRPHFNTHRLHRYANRWLSSDDWARGWHFQARFKDGAFRDTKIDGTLDDGGQFHGSFSLMNATYLVEPSSTLRNASQGGTYGAIVFKISDIVKCRLVNGKLHRVTEKEVNSVKRRRLMSVDGLSLDKDVGQMAKRSQGEKKRSIICDLKIVVDYCYLKHVAKMDRAKAVSSVVNLIRKVDSLFREVDFDGDGQSDNLGFYITDVKVHLDPIGDNGTACDSEWDPVQFFTELRRYDFSNACAGLLFTYRRMQSPELYGPSIIKSTFPSNDYGICSQGAKVKTPPTIMENYDVYVANAVPVNFMHNGRVFKDTTHMVIQIAHQLAQLFGAPTDDDTVACKTFNPSEMNIMAFPVPPGYYSQNLKFSQCSKAAIGQYLANMTRPCLRYCEGPDCTVKRSATNLSSDVSTTLLAVDTVNNTSFTDSGSNFQRLSVLVQLFVFNALLAVFF